MILVDAKLLWRDWRGGQLNLIISALVSAVMVVTAVSLLADRVERGLNEQISSFLAADLSLRASIPMEEKFSQQGEQLGLQLANVAQFRSMVFFGEQSHLASVKAVEPSYPLRGLMELSAKGNTTQIEKLSHGPPSGEVWVEPRLLALLDIELGQQLEVGYSNLTVSRLIAREPDRGIGFSVAGARVMMNYDDVQATQLIRPGSQIRYKLLMAGNEQQLSAYQQWFKQENAANEGEDGVSHFRLESADQAEQGLSDALERGRAFLLLSGTIGVLLAGLAMALASHRYARRLTDQVALMKAWGQSSGSIRRSHLIRLLIIASTATLLGLFCGWVAHYLLLEFAKELFEAVLPAPGWRPWFVATVTGFVCVIGFALPALWHLPGIAPLKVLRRDISDNLVSRASRSLIGIAALMVLTYWYSGSIIMSGLFLAALFSLFAICALIALQILKGLQSFGHWRGSYIRLGLANLWRRRAQTLIQLVGFATTLMLLLVAVGMRTNLIAEWQAQLPQDAPSHFLFNVATPELPKIKQLLNEEQVTAGRWYPMVRGRLVGLNGEPMSRERLNRTDGLAREVNLTQASELPAANQVIRGRWWGENTPQEYEFSLEQEVAEAGDFVIGDEVEFSVGGLTFSATLTSIRTVDWQNMSPNFYIVFSPGALDRFSPNWVTSVRDPETEADKVFGRSAPFVNRIIKQFPTAVVIELGQIIKQIQNVITRVTQGLEMILLLVLACGALVLFAAIGVSYDERLRESAVLRTLGSSRKVILGATTTEFAVLGAIAGLISVFGAETILYFVQIHIFDMEPSLHPQLWLIGVVSGVSIITILGLLRSREIITVPPLQSLRQIS